MGGDLQGPVEVCVSANCHALPSQWEQFHLISAENHALLPLSATFWDLSPILF